MVKTYLCPLCGKRYTNPIAMAQCATACAEAEAKRDKAKEAAIAKAELNVKEAYTLLLDAIAEYKAAGGTTTYTASLVGNTVNSRNIKIGDTKDWTTSKTWFTIPDNVKVEFVDNFDNTNAAKKLDNVYSKQKIDKSDLESFLKDTLDIKDGVKKSKSPWGSKTSTLKTPKATKQDVTIEEFFTELEEARKVIDGLSGEEKTFLGTLLNTLLF